MKDFVAYTRVSTEGQGIGLDAQMDIINAWVKNNGGNVIATLREKASGKNLNRPVLKQALDMCRQTGATLIVAKLDRLSRDVADIFTIRKRKGLDLIVCDIDANDTMMLGIFATLAQKERQLISTRTREALAAKKIQLEELRKAYLLQAKHEEEFGNFKRAKWLRQEAEKLKLGNPNAGAQLREVNRQGAAKRNQMAADAVENKHAYLAIRLMTGTLQQKADFLNENGFRTRNGKTFAPTSVKRLIALFEKP